MELLFYAELPRVVHRLDLGLDQIQVERTRLLGGFVNNLRRAGPVGEKNFQFSIFFSRGVSKQLKRPPCIGGFENNFRRPVDLKNHFFPYEVFQNSLKDHPVSSTTYVHCIQQLLTMLAAP
jgi:hypothetical protein